MLGCVFHVFGLYGGQGALMDTLCMHDKLKKSHNKDIRVPGIRPADPLAGSIALC